MAAELTQDAVLCFLRSRGGSVTNTELLLHFRPFLREHADQSRNRETFKKFVNSVARVKQEDGVSYVVLLRKFRGHCPGVDPGVSGQSRGASPGATTPGKVLLSPLRNADKPRNNENPEPGTTPAGPHVLPAAGIILNNNIGKPTPNPQQRRVQQNPVSGAPPVPVPVPVPPPGDSALPLAPVRKEDPVAPGPKERVCVLPKQKERVSVTPEPRREQTLVPVCSARLAGQPRTVARTSAPLTSSVCPGPAPDVPGQGEASVGPVERDVCAAPRRVRLRQSYRSAVSVDEEDDEEEEDVQEEVAQRRRASAPFDTAAVWDGATVGMQARGMSKSTPALDTVPVLTPGPETRVQSLEERDLPGLRAPPAVCPQKVSPVRTVPQIHIQDVEPNPGRGSDPVPRFRGAFSPLISSHHYSSSSSSNVERCPRASSWSSHEELLLRGGQGGAGGPGVAEHQGGGGWPQSAEGGISGGSRGRVWHRSTGDLQDDEEGTSDASTPLTLHHPSVARRHSSNLRKRLCLSVGAELDQIMDEEDHRALGGSEAARLHRLQLISSSLSLGHLSSSSLSSCSTPPRCHSLADLTDKESPRERRSVPSTAQHQEGHSRRTQVPLEEREHLWLLNAAAGIWPDIYSLFREDPSLLQRRDFISGFTVLHWIAKHGDHRVLNTLWYGVEKAGLVLDTDTQSSCGYTPLHIAAIHNHKNIIRLLVNKFGASVSLRDAAGKKAWSYLPQEAPLELFQLLGAPAKAALGQTGLAQPWAAPQIRQPSQKRSRRHHFSTASGQRPALLTGDAKVKRTSSLAYLKHKTLQKLKAEWAI